jgi:hypothetical protein
MRDPRLSVALLLALFLTGCAADQRAAQIRKAERELPALIRGPEKLPEGTYFGFAYFKEADKGLYLATSTDGYKWRNASAGQPLFISPIWLRDPCVKRGPGGTFHCVFTAGEGDGFGYAFSTNLVKWTQPREIKVMQSIPGLQPVWAPELLYDEEKQRWIVAWSSEVPGMFEETRGQAKVNMRIWYATTTDFKSFSEPKVLYDPGYTCIDATFIKAKGRYHLFFKDERDNPSKKQVRVATASAAEGPYGKPSDALTVTRVEAPAAAVIGSDYMVYFDEYRWGRYGAIRSPDLESWTDVSKLMSFPEGMRHGSVFPIPREIGEKLHTP